MRRAEQHTDELQFYRGDKMTANKVKGNEKTTNKEINAMIRSEAGRKVSKIKKSPEAKKNQAINDAIRSRAGRR